VTTTPLRSTEAAARWLREWVRGSLRTDFTLRELFRKAAPSSPP